MASCCNPRGCDRFFGPRFARRMANRYRKRGLDKVARRMAEFLEARGIEGATVLEVGGGIGEIQIDILNRQVRAGDSVVHLSGIEQSLLYLLASRGGRTVTREEILDAVWGTDFVAESNLVDRHIRSLRIKLQNGYRHPRFIATVPGKGYRFLPIFSNEGWDSGSGSPKAN